MADIGSLLRETRIRNKIDITAVEEATKIRAKYLRALENEEWVLLPGPAYVKTFLRTYAQFLGLDPHLLVEEYSARFEEPEELEVAAFTPKRRLPERTRRVGPPTRGIGVALLLVGFLGFLLVLGLT
ncbi:MAG: helix-turn-helix domain-containing protein, partial [Solirubrobacterales bacterium]